MSFSVTDRIYLPGLALANYKGLGSDIQFMGPFKAINFFAGANNSGKSSILEFIAVHAVKFLSWHSAGDAEKDIRTLDMNVEGSKSDFRVGICWRRQDLVPKLAAQLSLHSQSQERQDAFDQLLKAYSDPQQLLWMNKWNGQLLYRNAAAPLPDETVKVLNGWISPASSWEHLHQWKKTIVDSAADWFDTPSLLIPSLRQLTYEDGDEETPDGTGFVNRLARIQNPSEHGRNVYAPFNSLNRFLQEVTETPSLRIEVSHDHVLSVIIEDKKLPIDSLGMGLQQLIVIGVNCVLNSGSIICIEEPELHLHPTLQRRLIEYLDQHTNNQYFIATHSASLLDTEGAAVFQVGQRDGFTHVQATSASAERWAALQEMGYRQSDLIQSNCIIWVEGPSDRLYIRHWLKAIDADLREGIDYAIMFYGGRLLAHLSATDISESQSDIEALITLRNINQHLAFIIDSDKPDDTHEVNGTKRRVQQELAERGGLCWITEGREIENYVPQPQMKAALLAAYPKTFEAQVKTGQFDHVLPFVRRNGEQHKEVDKMEVARQVCLQDANLDVLDLRERTLELVNFVRRCNGRPPLPTTA